MSLKITLQQTKKNPGFRGHRNYEVVKHLIESEFQENRTAIDEYKQQYMNAEKLKKAYVEKKWGSRSQFMASIGEAESKREFKK